MSGDSHRPDQQIRVSADRLVADRTAATAIFTGRVKVVRGNSTIEADRLTVYYSRKNSGKDSSLPVQSAIEKIIAEGDVRIQSEQLSARTAKAVYSRPAQTVVLTGTGSRVISGSNSITGAKIMLYLDGQRLTVSGDEGKRVKAVLEPAAEQ